MTARECSKPRCTEGAIGTLSFDYREAVAVFGPLSPEPSPPSIDLCARHYAGLVVPRGWRLIVHASFQRS